MAQRQRQRLAALRNDPQLARFVVQGRPTGKALGNGSYGSVEEIDVSGLLCAGKRLHELLLDADNAGVENLALKYVQECQLMSDLRHPNITQFLGVCFLAGSQLPVLLMELLDCSLDELVESIPNIPLVLKRSMLEDVARGLTYLHNHRPQIIHRDLTAKNILLTASLVAKVTDFGNSRIVNLQPGQLARTLSRVPGTLLYMPPEALEDSSRYGPSLDIFSYGHLSLFTLLQVFPDKLLQPNYADPNDPTKLIGRSEVGRRERYLNQLEEKLNALATDRVKCLLIQVIKDCLRNFPSDRPTAEQLVTALVGMKSDIEGCYGDLATIDAVRQVKTVKTMKRSSDELVAKEEEIFHLRQQLEGAEERHVVELNQKDEQKNVEMTRLQETHEAVLRQKDAQLDEQRSTNQRLTAQLREKDEQKNREVARLQETHEADVHHLRTQLREKDVRMREMEESRRQLVTQLQQKEVELEQKNADISRLQGQVQRNADISKQTPVPTPLSELKLPLKLKWRRGKDLPFGTYSWPQVALLKEKVYIGGGGASPDKETTVIVYDPQQDSCETLPPYSYKYFSMAVVNNQLVLVGGVDVRTRKVTNKLGVWNGQWTHPLPPMTTARHLPSVVTHNNRWLVVMGGSGGVGVYLSRVEILDMSKSSQWYHAAQLPHPCSQVFSVTIGNMCYLLGGFTTGGVASKKVLSVCLDSLITQAVSQPAGASAPPTSSPWQALPDTPRDYSTALAFNGALLAVGGDSKDIYHYQPSSKRWIKAGELPTARGACTCTVLPSGKVFVAGGSGSAATRVDIAFVE